MATIDDVSTNDMNFKHLDTSKDIVITPMNEYGGKALLNADHTWTAKVSDGNNYVGDYPVTIEPNGIVVNSADFTSLPAGYYHLEIWEEWIDSNSKKQRSIYPSPQRTIDFTIYQNVTDLAEKEIKTIGFQDVVDQAVMNIGMNYVFKVNTIEPDQTATVVQSSADGKNYVTFNIPRGYKGDKGDPGVPGDPGERGLPGKDGLTPQIDAKTGHWMLGTLDTGVTAKGDKGDTGTVDNAGLTNAPAFQALQGNVTNLQSEITTIAGVNLANGTSSEDQSYGDASQTTGWRTPIIATFANPQPGQQYTISVNTKTNGGSWRIQIWDGTSPTQRGKEVYGEPPVVAQEQNHIVTFTWPSGSNKYLLVQLVNNNDGGQIVWNSAMIEEGTVAHDWSPNPSEILTQSDYAKIKAAIVALGGSLS